MIPFVDDKFAAALIVGGSVGMTLMLIYGAAMVSLNFSISTESFIKYYFLAVLMFYFILFLLLNKSFVVENGFFCEYKIKKCLLISMAKFSPSNLS